MEPDSFEGTAGRTLEDSTPWWPPLPSAPEGAPNIVMVLLDDVGYAQFGCYGSDIATPTFDRLAADGLRYSNFHTTALCSPTRACLLTGRNHHTNGMGRIVEFSSGFPGYDATMPKANGFLSEILGSNGYATFAVGKWHLAPANEMAIGAPRDTLAARARLRSVLRVPRPARPTSTTPISCTTTTRSIRPARRRRGTTSPRTWPTRRSLHQGPARRRARASRSSSTSHRARATRRIRRRSRTIDRYRGQVRPGLGPLARRDLRPPAASRGCCREGTRAERAAALDPGVGRRSATTSGGSTPG